MPVMDWTNYSLVIILDADLATDTVRAGVFLVSHLESETRESPLVLHNLRPSFF
jgi:hypothetical protein